MTNESQGLSITERLETLLEECDIHDTPGTEAVWELARAIQAITGQTGPLERTNPEHHEQVAALLEHPDLENLDADVLRYVAGRLDAVDAMGLMAKLRGDASAKSVAAEEALLNDMDESAEDEVKEDEE